MIQIALTFSPECAEELEAMGFTSQTVYTKVTPHVGTGDPNDRGPGDREFFGMRRPPHQFVTTSFWGRGAD